MGHIYRYSSQESLRQNFFPTQGVNENYGAFVCRFAGVQIKVAEPDTYLRRMNSGASNRSQVSFKDHCSNASTSKGYHSLSGDRVPSEPQYYFHMRADTLKQASSHNKNRADKAIIEQPEIHSRYREASDKPKKTVFQRLLNFLTRCFMPCSKVKT